MGNTVSVFALKRSVISSCSLNKVLCDKPWSS